MENQNSTSTNQPVANSAPQPAAIQQSQTPISQKPANKFSLKLIIGIIIFLLLAGGAAASYIYREPLMALVSKPTPTHTKTIETSPSPTPDPTADWKTYRNTAFYYSVKYPNDWTVGVKGESDIETFSAPHFDSPCLYSSGQLCSQIFIEISKPTSPTDLDPQFDIDGPGDQVSNKKSILIDGENASEFDYFQFNYGAPSVGRLLHVVVTQKNNYKYTFTYSESQKDQLFKTPTDWKDKKTFDQILSTFKFTDSNTSDSKSVNTPFTEFQIPNKWNVWKCSDVFYTVMDENFGAQQNDQGCPWDGNPEVFSIRKIIPAHRSLDDEIPKSEPGNDPLHKGIQISDKEYIKIDGQNAITYKMLVDQNGPGDGTYLNAYVLPSSINIATKEKLSKEDFVQILSTFKFTK